MAAHSTRQTLYGTVAGMTMYHLMLECCLQTRMETANSEIQEAFRFLVSMQRYSFSSKIEYNQKKEKKNTAQGALVTGYSAIDDFGDLLGCCWKTAMEHELAVYVDRVPTDSNVSDGPSRSRFQELEQRGAKWLTTAPSPCLSSRAVFWEEVVGRSDMTRSTVSAVCTGTSPSSGSTSSLPAKGNRP